MSSLRRISLILICLLFSSASLQAATQTQTMNVVIAGNPNPLTNWSTSLVFNRFDPSLGQLLKVTISMTDDVNGQIRLENTGNQKATVTSHLTATITLQRPDTTTLVSNTPNASFSDDLDNYDGTTDFMGTSGKTHDIPQPPTAGNTQV